jgi:DNA-binding MurR/RpiR family transcriptional regulator
VHVEGPPVCARLERAPDEESVLTTQTQQHRDDSSAVKGTCLVKLRSEAQKGTRAGRKIAEKLLAAPNAMLRYQIGELAAACDVAVGTVTAFCRKLGYAGYREFQLGLSAAIATVPAGDPQTFFKGSSPSDIMRQVFACARTGLDETERMNEPDVLQDIAARLLFCRRIVLLGIGSSGSVAGFGEVRFASLGLSAVSLTDPFRMIFVSGSADEKDVFIGISHTGETSHVVEAMGTARRRHAFTVAVTNYPQSTLAKASDQALITSYREHVVNAAVSSSDSAQICLLDSLYFVTASISRDSAVALARSAEDRVQRMLRIKSGSGNGKPA